MLSFFLTIFGWDSVRPMHPSRAESAIAKFRALQTLIENTLSLFSQIEFNQSLRFEPLKVSFKRCLPVMI